MASVWVLQRVALPLLLLDVACAHVQETRTRQIVDDESVRLSETPRPDLSTARVRATLTGRELRLMVGAEARCVVQFGERMTTRERIQRSPSVSTLAGEAVLMGVGVAVGISARRSSDESHIDGRDVLGVLALAGGLGAGAALVIDASKFSDTERVRSETVPEGEARVAPCKSSRARPARVELATLGGRRFSAPLDGFGRARLLLPDDVWSEDRVDFDVSVDGVLVQRLVLMRAP